MANHCMHMSESKEVRYCCWCAMQQHAVYTEMKLSGHGPHGPLDITFHWEPSSTKGDCVREPAVTHA